MLFSRIPTAASRILATGLVSGLALAMAACSGASSDEPAATASDDTGVEKIANKTGALADMTLGADDAPITVIEYASLTCPHCATFHETIFPEIKRDYVDTGKVRFVFREFPTAPANLAVAGSMVARCAADKGGADAYFLVLGALFKTQRTWLRSDDPRGELMKVATQAGMDEAAFDSCIQRQELLDLINDTITEGRDKYQIASTPSFVINGDVRHPNSAEDFAKILDEVLEKSEENSG